MKGIILVNAYSKLKSSTNQANRLKDEFAKLNVNIDIKCNNFFAAHIENGKIAIDLSDYDFCIYLDKDKYISQMLEMSGLRLFNSHASIEDCDDKMLTYIKLANSGLRLIDTLPGLLCYNQEESINIDTVLDIEHKFNYPIVIKESFGSLGKGIHKAENREELLDIMERVKCQPHLFQEMVTSSYGRDIRVIVIGGKVIASMERISSNDFRSNIELGGKGVPLDEKTLPMEFKEAAIQCAKILKLDYCGVDLLYSKDNKPIVCEVNSNAFFGGIENVTKINVAKAYAEYILKELSNQK